MGEHVNAKWNTFLGYLVSDCLNYLKFQFDRDNFYQMKETSTSTVLVLVHYTPFSILLLHFLKFPDHFLGGNYFKSLIVVRFSTKSCQCPSFLKLVKFLYTFRYLYKNENCCLIYSFGVIMLFVGVVKLFNI